MLLSPKSATTAHRVTARGPDRPEPLDSHRHPWRALLVATLLALALETGLALALADAAFPQGFVGTVATAPTAAAVGERVTVSGEGFPPDTALSAVWQTDELGWRLGVDADGEYNGDFQGLAHGPAEHPLATPTTNADGAFRFTFEVPEDLGGTHNILIRQEGVNLNQAGLQVQPSVTMSPDSGPIGTDITITIKGLNSGHPMVWYLLSYDHRIAGFVSAVTTHGTARVVVPAVGIPGPHFIRFEDSPFGHPYMALPTSPYAFLEMPTLTFRVTDGDPVLPAAVAEQAPPAQPGVEPPGSGPAVWMDPAAATVGTPAVLHGRGFAPDAALDLKVSNMAGSRVTASGFEPVQLDLANVTADADGGFALRVAYPDMLGGFHRVSAVDSGGADLAHTRVKVLQKPLPLASRELDVGQPFELHLKGIGWSQTENIFAIVVDNTYIGYACGFSTNGDVRVPLLASFTPGWHFIDLYPSFYRNKDYSQVDEAPFLFRAALLTWRDHPSGFHVRYAVYVRAAD